ncbi:glycosyl hydrolase family 85-domain-containing protein [Myxozyma melibiosi]|uniref:Glycosyl hydrolase family 85-domain-containing protein n=1 Tax=Myxozyma melibiosi TaxID=54550 RepID=A0ABR1F9F5_9ASCO
MSTATLCRKFSDLDELSSWYESLLCSRASKSREPDDLQISRSRLRPRHRHPDSILSPRLLVCHDFKGGYSANEDADFQGYFPHESGTAYWIRAFELIDTFIYFSHTRVAVPPATWTTASHRNGVCCLGTLIFEFTKEATADARKLLTPNAGGIGYHYADVLAQVANYFGFDGYLLNVETVLGSSAEAREMLNFIEYFKFALHKLVGPHARVIWYDSLTTENKISYQDCLNLTTLPFFRVADGLFTNYFWKEKQVFDGAKLAGMVYRLDLWTGIDVWGRGVHYPAKFGVGKAMKQIEQAGTSIALFAPAWVYEDLGSAEFEMNDYRFWYTQTDEETGDPTSISRSISPHPAPVLHSDAHQLFYTSFTTGHGTSFFVNGKKEFAQSWVNHALQTALPTYPHESQTISGQAYAKALYDKGISTAPPGSFKITCSIDYSSAFYGGSSLKLVSDPHNVSPYQEAIFPSSDDSESSDWSSYSGRSPPSPSAPFPPSPEYKSRRRSSDRSLGRKVSATQMYKPRVRVVPLFLLDFELRPLQVFTFFVSFFKCVKGDVKIRLAGYWTTADGAGNASAGDLSNSEDYSERPFEADLSGSVLNTWVRKSFSFQVPAIPDRLQGERSETGAGLSERRRFRFVINHLDVVCSDNFAGAIRLGSLLLFSSSSSASERVGGDGDDSCESVGKSEVEAPPSLRAPARVTGVVVERYGGEGARALRWADDGEGTAEWIVYVNRRMAGVTAAPGWLDQQRSAGAESKMEVRVDSVGWGGAIVRGTEETVVSPRDDVDPVETMI